MGGEPCTGAGKVGLGEAGVGGNGFKAMRGGGNDIQGAVHTAGGEAFGIGFILGEEEFDVAYANPCRGQAGEIRTARSDSIGGHLIGTGFGGEKGSPAAVVLAVVPDFVGDGIKITIGGGAVIEHGAKEPLGDGLRTGLVVDALNETGGESASGTLPTNGDPGGIDVQAGGG